MKEIYLDNNATTRVAPEVAEVMMSCLSGHYGNASSVHFKGVDAERFLNNARQTVSRMLKVPAKSVVFTSGGTESNNTIIKGLAEARKKQGRHIVTTAIEHASVLGVMKQLEAQGFSITRLDPNEQGIVEPDQVLNAVTDETIMVSVGKKPESGPEASGARRVRLMRRLGIFSNTCLNCHFRMI